MKIIIKTTLFLLLSILFFACYQGRPSDKPPIHLNPNMDDQPKYKPLAQSKFFVDGSAMRQPVPGTVARGELREDAAYYLGRDKNGNLIKQMPVAKTVQLLKRGQQRYNIYCSPCHDKTGAGKGIIVQKGFMPPPSFYIDRLKEAPDGHIYDVITNGIRNMPAYRHQVPVPDRWAIVSYVRALQRSQNASIEDVPEQIRKELK